jgi:hypothetical protein
MIYPAPSYLRGLVTEVSPATLPKIKTDYGDNTTAFKFNNMFTALILSWNEEYEEYGGRVWGVETTGNKLLIFDQVKHGYNGVMQLNEEDDIGSIKTIEFTEPSEVIVVFQYSGDEADYLEEGTSKFEQDYFGWIAIYKHTDNKTKEIISFECA